MLCTREVGVVGGAVLCVCVRFDIRPVPFWITTNELATFRAYNVHCIHAMLHGHMKCCKIAVRLSLVGEVRCWIPF